MASIGRWTCLARGIWARRPWNPLGQQAVWYDHDFERINERDVFGIKWYDARCRRCGEIETGWRDALPLHGQERSEAIARAEQSRPSTKSPSKTSKPTKSASAKPAPSKPAKASKAEPKSFPKLKLKR